MMQHRILASASRALAGTFVVTGLVVAAGVARAQGTASNSSDAQLQAAVSAALAADAQLRGQQVSATVSQGVVTLSGSVADDVQRTAAEQTAAGIAGVRSIDDSIAVGGRNVAAASPAPAPGQGVGQNVEMSTAQSPDANMPPPPQSPNANMPPPPPADTMQPQGQYSQPEGQYPQHDDGYPQGGGQFAPPPPPPPGPYGANGQYPPQRGQYPPRPYVPGVAPEKQNASGPVTLNPGLLLNVRASEPLSTGVLKDGQYVQFTAASDLYANGVVAVPRGAVLTGMVIEAKNAGPFGGSPRLVLKLTTLTLGAQTYPLVSDVWSSQGPSKAGYTAGNTVGGAAFGALIGAIAGGGVGAGVGAVAGGAGGALVSGATHGPRLDLPAEALLQFHLAAPLTVQPVNYNEAERLAASVPQQPVLRPRPVYAVAPYPYYARPYPYPAPYYYGRY